MDANVRTPETELRKRASRASLDVLDEEFALFLDENDPLGQFRERFVFPKNKTLPSVDMSMVEPNEDCIYLCGHSLGLRPKNNKNYINGLFDDWDQKAVDMHFHGKFSGTTSENELKPFLAELTGAEEDEIAAMNGLTVNLNILTMTFYKPSESKHKILIEDHSFSSDRYAMQALLTHYGYDPDEDLIEIKPKNGEFFVRDEDIIGLIEERGHEIAMILLSGVQYYTGQLFDMKKITEVGHQQDCVVGFDLAHAVGNVKIQLHEWEVDFAVWCSYKYLCSGPGGIGGLFVHRNNFEVKPAQTGWWGNKTETRFKFYHDQDRAVGADAFKSSNASPFLVAMAYSGLENFHDAGMDRILEKQFLLTGYLELLLKENFNDTVTDELIFDGSEPCKSKPLVRIITPEDHKRRGSQISVSFGIPAADIAEKLSKFGIMVDFRRPNVFRIGPMPLYNTYMDIFKFVFKLKKIVD